MNKLDDYLCFVAIVETNNLSNAATRLHKSVSSISKQLTRLEQRLGIQLLVRSTHAVGVTKAGQAFYLDCKSILEQVKNAEEKICQQDVQLSGQISIGLPDVFMQSPIVDLLTSFRKQHPHIDLNIQCRDSIDNLMDHQLDFVFRTGELADSNLVSYELSQFDMVACASPSYLESSPALNSFGDLESHTLLVTKFNHHSPLVSNVLKNLTEFPSIKKRLEQHWLKTGEANIISVNNGSALLNAVLAGMGITIMPEFCIHSHCQQGRLVKLTTLPIPISRQLWLLHHRHVVLPNRMRTFKQFVIDELPRFIK